MQKPLTHSFDISRKFRGFYWRTTCISNYLPNSCQHLWEETLRPDVLIIKLLSKVQKKFLSSSVFLSAILQNTIVRLRRKWNFWCVLKIPFRSSLKLTLHQRGNGIFKDLPFLFINVRDKLSLIYYRDILTLLHFYWKSIVAFNHREAENNLWILETS